MEFCEVAMNYLFDVDECKKLNSDDYFQRQKWLYYKRVCQGDAS
jgi:hypothetical protein